MPAFNDRQAKLDAEGASHEVALADAVRDLLLQIDDGPRGCYGTQRSGEDVWKGSFLARIERLRALVNANQ